MMFPVFLFFLVHLHLAVGWGWRKTTRKEIHPGFDVESEKEQAKLLEMVATATVSTSSMPQKWKFRFNKAKSPEELAKAINFKRELAEEKLMRKHVKGLPKHVFQFREVEIHKKYCPNCDKIFGCKKRQQLLTAARRGEFEAKCKLAGIEIENPGFFKRVWRGIARAARGSKDMIVRPFRRTRYRD